MSACIFCDSENDDTATSCGVCARAFPRARTQEQSTYSPPPISLDILPVAAPEASPNAVTVSTPQNVQDISALQRHVHRARRLGRVIAATLRFACFVVALKAAALGFTLFCVMRFRTAPYPAFPEQMMSVSRALDGLARIELFTILAVGLPWMVWTMLSHKNIKRLGRTETELHPVVAGFGWCVPFFNLVIPFVAAREIWCGSHPDARTAKDGRRFGKGPVGVWWMSFLAASFANVISTNMLASVGRIEDLDQLLSAMTRAVGMGIIGAIALLVAGRAAIALVRGVGERQTLAAAAATTAALEAARPTPELQPAF